MVLENFFLAKYEEYQFLESWYFVSWLLRPTHKQCTLWEAKLLYAQRRSRLDQNPKWKVGQCSSEVRTVLEWKRGNLTPCSLWFSLHKRWLYGVTLVSQGGISKALCLMLLNKQWQSTCTTQVHVQVRPQSTCTQRKWYSSPVLAVHAYHFIVIYDMDFGSSNLLVHGVESLSMELP